MSYGTPLVPRSYYMAECTLEGRNMRPTGGSGWPLSLWSH